MSKFTQTNKIEILEALSCLDVFSKGANKPLLVRCINSETKKRQECVLKLMGASRMGPDAAARELLATFIAWEWEISVVEPVIIEVTKDFLQNFKNKPEYLTVSKSLGRNIGSIYMQNLTELPITQKLNDSEIEQGLLIFVFDIFIGNPDRTFDKPNSFSDGKNLIIFDHELAFSYILDIQQNNEPYNLRENDLIWINKLYLKNKLKNHILPRDKIIDCIAKIDNVFWDKSFALIPDSWHTWQLEAIRKYVDQIVENRIKFVDNIKYLLG